MSRQAVDAFIRATGRASDRRASVKALGVAVLGTTLASPRPAAARKGRNRRKKRCQREQKQCRRAAQDFCQEENPVDPQECAALLLPCCRSCKATSVMLCVLGLLD